MLVCPRVHPRLREHRLRFAGHLGGGSGGVLSAQGLAVGSREVNVAGHPATLDPARCGGAGWIIRGGLNSMHVHHLWGKHGPGVERGAPVMTCTGSGFRPRGEETVAACSLRGSGAFVDCASRGGGQEW